MKYVRQSVCACLCAAVVFSLGGCASVMSGRHARVAINSNAPNSRVVVKDRRGETVATAETPAVVELKRSDGFLKPAHYTATIEAPGYEPTQVAIDPKLNPWIFGNVLLGGVIGAVVDPATGAMWNLTPNEIKQELVAARPNYDTQVR
jgi:hypothetical protein